MVKVRDAGSTCTDSTFAPITVTCAVPLKPSLVAVKVAVPQDGPCIFTGRTAIYTGAEDSFDDGAGHVLPRDIPVPVCDKTGWALESLRHADITVTPTTWHYAGGGCC